MPNFDIIKECAPKKSFRVASVIGKFDLQTNKMREQFKGSIDLPEKWKVGLIIGKSGTGKTTIAKELFPDSYIFSYEYKSESILDDMPENATIEEITSAFNSVGFSSPPSWLKPYSVLSNGQKMRVDLARAILEETKLFVFDEFTSVVDRNVAKIGSFAVQKAIRKTDKQFIAVTCHDDVIEWLLPDWIFNCDSMAFQIFEGQKKNRPAIKFEVYSTRDKEVWKVFAKHHYLNHNHHIAAEKYVAMINDEIAGFISIMHFPHPKTKNMKKVHRLVILPDYQGIGIGIRLLNEVGRLYKEKGNRFSITSSAPSLISALKKSNKWAATRFDRSRQHKGKTVGSLQKTSSSGRLTATFELL